MIPNKYLLHPEAEIQLNEMKAIVTRFHDIMWDQKFIIEKMEKEIQDLKNQVQALVNIMEIHDTMENQQ